MTSKKNLKRSKAQQNARRIKNKRFTQRVVLGIFVIAFAIIFGLTISYFKNKYLRPLPETLQTNMTKVPKEVKKTYSYIATTSATFRIPIFLYHYIEYVKNPKDKIRASLNITPDIFASQLQTLKNSGYTFITQSDLDNILNGKVDSPQNPIILSFDDGYRDFYTDAFPILKRFNAKSVAYISPGLLDTPNYLFSWQLKEIAGSKFVEIGAHTVNHISLKGLDYKKAKKEIEISRALLQKQLNVPVATFAYPYGAFDLQAITLVKQAGFTSAVSTIPGVEENAANRFYIYRIRPGKRTGVELLSFLKQTDFKPW